LKQIRKDNGGKRTLQNEFYNYTDYGNNLADSNYLKRENQILVMKRKKGTKKYENCKIVQKKETKKR